jgi:hypothetical protein
MLVELGDWGKKYRGDFIAGAIAFLVPFLITIALKGFSDIITLTSLIGLVSTLIILLFSREFFYDWALFHWRQRKFQAPAKLGILNGCLSLQDKECPSRHPYMEYSPSD